VSDIERFVPCENLKTCCGIQPWLDTWDDNEARSIFCTQCGKTTGSHFMRKFAYDDWESGKFEKKSKQGGDMPELPKTPNKSNSNRHIVRYREKKLYIMVIPDEMEVFISRIDKPEERYNDDEMAVIDTITRLTSKLWNEHKSLDTIIEQLSKASRVKHDLPGILAVILGDYQE